MAGRRIRHISAVLGVVLVIAAIGVLVWPPSNLPARGERRIRGAAPTPLPTVTTAASPAAVSPSPSAPPAEDEAPTGGGQAATTASPTPDESASGAADSGVEPSVPEPTAPSYEIAAAGDIACDPTNAFFRGGRGTAKWCRHADTAQVIQELAPDMVVPLGDVQYDDASMDQFRRSYDRSWGRFKDITYPVIGNHEYYSGTPAGYFDYFGRRAGAPARGWYSLDRAGWHLVMLNSNCVYEVSCKPGSPQYRWLEQDLASSSSTCQVAFLHHPRFSSGPHGGERAITPLWRVLYQRGVDVVLSAHDHIYERFAKQTPDGVRDPDRGIRQITVGTGGAEHYWVDKRATNSVVRNTKTFGVLRLSLGAGSYAWEFVGVGRRSFSDSGSDVCH
jgi:3',5'-cyclic AMP phosphodiesterase CpdA